MFLGSEGQLRPSHIFSKFRGWTSRTCQVLLAQSSDASQNTRALLVPDLHPSTLNIRLAPSSDAGSRSVTLPGDHTPPPIHAPCNRAKRHACHIFFQQRAPLRSVSSAGSRAGTRVSSSKALARSVSTNRPGALDLPEKGLD